MIEVEKKFALRPGDRERLTKGLEPFAIVTMVDTYYDDSAYLLSRNDTWLRNRNGTFEVKVPLHPKSVKERKGDRFREIEDDEGIREFLRLPRSGDIGKEIASAGYLPFATITTVRKKYRYGDMVIDLDSIDYGYELAEVEVMVNDRSEMDAALETITTFARSVGLSSAPVRGKVIEYIRRTNPRHFHALVDAGLIEA